MTNERNPKRQRKKEYRNIKAEQRIKELKARKRRSALIGIGLVALVFAAVIVQQSRGADQAETEPQTAEQTEVTGPNQFATFVTSQGEIKVRLLSETAPNTVDNFVGLATGQKEWTDPSDDQVKNDPLYDGTIFHRVIPGFMIQGGDPLGTGTGGPGFQFEDETEGGPPFDKPGLLAMANSGPDTNGSQFFITVAPAAHLDGLHTVFGEVVEGQEVADAIVAVPTDREKPVEDVVLQEVRVSDT